MFAHHFSRVPDNGGMRRYILDHHSSRAYLSTIANVYVFNHTGVWSNVYIVTNMRCVTMV